ncbi:MAG: hypothetical protein Q7Q73_14460 [Verrucomicrobiota bacterium JB024]|nr:hypothetical protein [Verrucomicrobiota bacterium JB024]
MKKNSPVGKRGFALIIALSLMAFIFLLLLSMGTLLRVESTVSSVHRQQAQAKANALLALNVAMGNLQKLAGPDQRATAAADVLSSEGYAAIDPDDHARHWTGVWDATRSRGDGFLGWLVSAPAGGLLQAESDAVNLPQTTVTLVGAGTLGTAASMEAFYVEAPLASIMEPGGVGESGSFAYWIGDEGVKAKFQGTLPSEDYPSAPRAQDDFRLNQRNAVEMYGDLATEDVGGLIDASASNQPRSTTWGGLFLPDTANTILPADENILREGYFDFTPDSIGLLTDTKNGGWKKDLTWLFEEEDGAVADALEEIDAVAGVADSQITAQWPENRGRTHWAPAPTWDLLRSYYRLSRETEPLAVRSQTSTRHGIVPIIPRFIINFIPGLNGSLQDNGTPADSSDDYFTGNLRVYLDVQVVLWNPYDSSVRLPASDLEVLWTDAADGISPDMRMVFGDYGSASERQAHRGSLVPDFKGPTGEGFFNYTDHFAQATDCLGLKFRMPDTVMAPGEVLIFTVSNADNGTGYTGVNVLENRAGLGAPNTVWLELPDLIDQTSTPLNGHQVTEAFTFEKLDKSGGAGETTLVEHVALKRLGTAGDDAVENYSDYYARYIQRQMDSSDPFPQESNLDPLTDTASSMSNGFSLDEGQWLQFDVGMQASQTGYRNSRWAMNYNPRASVTGRSEVDLWNNPNHFGTWRCSPAVKLTNTVVAGTKTRVAERPIYYGPYGWQFQLSFFSLPRQGFKPLSLGDFQHVNAYPRGTSNCYLIANSLVDLRLQDVSDTVRSPNAPDTYAPVVDGSYLLNEALWDGYFFSTIDGSVLQADLDNGESFPNSRIQLAQGVMLDAFEDDPDRFSEGAADLTLDGAFNINSTSKEAWKMVLASSYGVRYTPQGDVIGRAQGVAFSRLLKPLGDTDATWRGYRELTKAELETLAGEIVQEIRRRGPFLTLADFVNRRLDAPASGAGLQGVLAQAIDNSGINSNDALGLPPDTNELSSINATAKLWYIEEALVGSRSAGAPRWLIQGDILQRIGGMISSRSDTFIIRTYGESASPITGEVGRAYLEATVQRSPEPVTPLAGAPTEPGDAFGRRFTIVSMKWLREEEI